MQNPPLVFPVPPFRQHTLSLSCFPISSWLDFLVRSWSQHRKADLCCLLSLAFLKMALLTFGDGEFLVVGATVLTVDYLLAHPAFTHE